MAPGAQRPHADDGVDAAGSAHAAAAAASNSAPLRYVATEELPPGDVPEGVYLLVAGPMHCAPVEAAHGGCFVPLRALCRCICSLVLHESYPAWCRAESNQHDHPCLPCIKRITPPGCNYAVS